MDFTALKTAITNAIKQNGNEEITGDVLQQILLSMVGSLGDSAINQLVTQNALLQSALSQEASYRLSKDNQLQAQINGVAADFDNILEQVRQLIRGYEPIIIHGDVTNAPDEEDLTSNVQHLLQFKNNAYNPIIFSGMGKVFLRKNLQPLSESYSFDGFVEGVTTQAELSGTPDQIFWDRTNEYFVGLKDGVYYLAWTDDDAYVPTSESNLYMYDGNPYKWNGSEFYIDSEELPNIRNVLTQDMINEDNTIYIIRYDYTLKDDITIPDNCVLEFDGGSISGNGDGQNTISTNNLCVISEKKCFSNIKFSGDCIANSIIKLDWFISQYPQSDNDYVVDNTNEVKDCFASGAKNILFPRKYIHLTDTIVCHKAINILTEYNDKSPNWNHHPTDKKNSKPCVFTNNIVTLFDYQIDEQYDDSHYVYKSNLYLGDFNCFIKTPFNNVTDINVPVLKITPISGMWGITIDTTFTGLRNWFSLDGHTGWFFNHTAIKIATSTNTGACSFVRINGNICGFNYGVYLHGEAHNTSGWFTDVIIKSDTQCCQGGIFDNVFPVTIYGNHQSGNFSHEQVEPEGYFVGDEIKLYGGVWDCGTLDAQSGFKTAMLPVKLTKSVENSFILQPLLTRDSYDYYPNNFVRVLNPINDYKFSFQNALYRALKPRNSYYWFIHPLSYTIQDDENSSPVSILTNYSNLINGDNLFNDRLIVESSINYREYKNDCYLSDCANKIIKLSFTILNTQMNAVFGEGGIPSVLLWQCYDSGVSIKVKVSYQDNGDTIVWYNYDNMASYYSGRLNVVKLPKVETINVEFEFTTPRYALILPSIIVPFYGSVDNNCVSSSIFSLPNLNIQERYGVQCYDLTTKKLNIWDGNGWYDALGIKNGVLTYGTFASKPTVSADEIPIGFKYFCTDKQTTEGATDGIEIIHKGSDVWVDALGRVVS